MFAWNMVIWRFLSHPFGNKELKGEIGDVNWLLIVDPIFMIQMSIWFLLGRLVFNRFGDSFLSFYYFLIVFNQVSDISYRFRVIMGQRCHTPKNRLFFLILVRFWKFVINFQILCYIVSKLVVVSITNYKIKPPYFLKVYQKLIQM